MSSTSKYLRNCEGYEIDRSDPRWMHPLLRNQAAISESGETTKDWFDPHVPVDERRRKAEVTVAPFRDFFISQYDTEEVKEQGEWLNEEIIEGCPEEENAPAFRVVIRIPKNCHRRKMPAVLLVGGGALAWSIPEAYGMYAYKFSSACNAVVVIPRYRPGLEAPYPAAVNDLHAAYAWMVKNEERLNIDSDRIALAGFSSGGQLAVSLAFRLKRYGFAPRGCVVHTPITDDRLDKPSSRYYLNDNEWDGAAIHLSALQYLRAENVASPLIGPEAFANHATVEECKGVCPMFINTFEHDPDSDYNREFVGKLKEAGVFVDYHLWGRCTHGACAGIDEDTVKFASKVDRVLIDAVADCLEYDLRRQWLQKK